MPDPAPSVDLGIDRSVLSRRNRPAPVGTSFAQATATSGEQGPQSVASDDAPASKRPTKKQSASASRPTVKKAGAKSAARAKTAAKKSPPAANAKQSPARQDRPSAPDTVPSPATTDPAPTTAPEEQGLAAAAAGEPASSTVEAPERPPRRVASVPSALAEAIAERCQRTGMRRRELVLAALEAHADELADLVAKDNAPKVKKVGLWEVPVDKKTSGHMTINMHLTPNNAVIMDDLVRRSGARGISQAVTVALAAYLGVQDT